MSENSRVYLIGAGPGDPGLFTIKGKECMEKADVVIFDYLANRRLLEYANPDAECIFVGKKGFTQHVTQDEINQIIIDKAKSAGVKTIARLKGGDPFVFGRGGEEVLALVEAGIAFEIVPGVTSGVAAPAYAGIPVTHRGVASSLAFITGHEDPTKDESAIDWEYLAKGVDTLCFYMGIKALPHITSRLIEAGREAQTPVALVRWGTTPQQEVLVSTLKEVSEEAARIGFQAPAIIVVGDVVSLRKDMAWFEKDKPLLNKKVVVTRSRTQASVLSKALENKGAEVFEFPTIKIVAPESFDLLDQAIQELDVYDWLIFTSVNGVDAFFERLRQEGLDTRALGNAQVAAIGPATADRIRRQGICPDVIPSEYKAEGVLDALLEAGVKEGTKILIPRALVAREILPDTLRDKGVLVDVVPAYETIVEDGGARNELIEKLQNNEVDALTFASSSTVKNFMFLLEEVLGERESLALLEKVNIASIGPITTQTIESYGLPVAIEASEYTISGLVQALNDYFAA